MYGTEPQYNEPRFNEILPTTNTIQKHKHKNTFSWYNEEMSACDQKIANDECETDQRG